MKVNLLTPKKHLTLKKMIHAIKQSYKKNLIDYSGREEVVLSNCLKNCHNTVIEQSGDIQFEIQTSIDITRELNRHRPLSIVESSTRYIDISNFREMFDISNEFLKRMDKKDQVEVAFHFKEVEKLYCNMVNKLSKEYARKILPLCTKTYITVTGNLWDWVKFLRSRLSKNAHPDIREIAKEIYTILNSIYPKIITKENLEYVKKLDLEI